MFNLIIVNLSVVPADTVLHDRDVIGLVAADPCDLLAADPVTVVLELLLDRLDAQFAGRVHQGNRQLGLLTGQLDWNKVVGF